MDTRIILLSIFSLLAVISAVNGAYGGRLGGYEPISNVNDPDVIEIANFAVNEYNKQAGTHLQFVKIVKGEQQVVAGMNYRLVIVAKDGSGSRKYEAVVYDVPWKHSRSLTSFNPL